jgi:hypothetical protein
VSISSTSSTRTTRCRTRRRRYLADQNHRAETGIARAPRTVTTLHGTDITLVGGDPSYKRVVASRSSSRQA